MGVAFFSLFRPCTSPTDPLKSITYNYIDVLTIKSTHCLGEYNNHPLVVPNSQEKGEDSKMQVILQQMVFY